MCYNWYDPGRPKIFDVSRYAVVTVTRPYDLVHLVGHPSTIPYYGLYPNDRIELGLQVPAEPLLLTCLNDLQSYYACKPQGPGEWKRMAGQLPAEARIHNGLMVMPVIYKGRIQKWPVYACRHSICSCGAVRWVTEVNTWGRVKTSCHDCGKQSDH